MDDETLSVCSDAVATSADPTAVCDAFSGADPDGDENASAAPASEFPADDEDADEPQPVRLFLHARRLCGAGHWRAALRSFDAAAALLHGPSRAALSILHARGWGGLARDVDAAVAHARAGCDLQCAESMGALAFCYMQQQQQQLEQQQQPLDDALMDRAVALASESAAAGSSIGCAVLGSMLSTSWHTVASDAGAAAAAFLRGARARHPCPDACYRSALCCSLGLGIPVDTCAAIAHLQVAASLGHPDAQYDIAGHYMKGEGLPQDKHAAVIMLSRAAEQGHIAACVALAGVITNGHLFDAYNDRASQLIMQAATAGNAFAQTVVGRLHEAGHTMFSFLEPQPVRERRAVIWYTRASDQGYVEAQALLGGLLIAGNWSCKEEQEEGRRLLEAAASKGHAGSLAILAAMSKNI